MQQAALRCCCCRSNEMLPVEVELEYYITYKYTAKEFWGCYDSSVGAADTTHTIDCWSAYYIIKPNTQIDCLFARDCVRGGKSTVPDCKNTRS